MYRLRTEGGMYAGKQTHLDEQLVTYIYLSVQPFPHEVRTRADYSCALLSANAP